MSHLVVSIHDVSPLTRETVDAMLADLLPLGLTRTSLLVIPHHHRRAHIGADPAFSPWLRRLVAAGHEPVLHGYHHLRDQLPGETLGTALATRFYTKGEGEFFDITLPAALTLLQRGRAELTTCAGIAPVGFIAPAWLLSQPGQAAARQAGFTYTTRLRTVENLATGHVIPSRSLCWSVRSAWRRKVSLIWNGLLFSRLRGHPLLRISLHPPDFQHPAIWAQIRALVGRALVERAPITYHGYISLSRQPPA